MIELYAATRDASFFNRPDTRTVKVFHVAVDVDGVNVRAACNQRGNRPWTGGLLDGNSVLPAVEVPIPLRCRRSGCQRRWPLRNPDLGVDTPGLPD